VLLVGLPEHAAAESKIKKLVFQDCAQAEAKMQELAPEQQVEFTSYLVRVLKMQLGVSTELSSDVSPTAPPLGTRDGIVSGNMWSVFEPSRELEAKHCALRLLTKGDRANLSLVPELIGALQESTVDPEFREAVEKAIWDITKRIKASEANATDPKVYSALISQLQSDSAGYLAGNVLIELWQNTLPFLLATLSSPDLRRQQIVLNLLMRLDREGRILGPALLPLIDSGDPLLRAKAIRILGSLKGFVQQSLSPIALHLADPSPEVSREALVALNGFFEDGSAKDVVIDPAVATQLFQTMQRGTPDVRAAMERVVLLLLSRHGELAPNVSALLKSSDPDLRERAVRILANSGLSSASALYEALYDTAFSVRLAAVRGLSMNAEKAEEKSSALLKALKRTTNEKDARVHQQFVLASAETVTKLPVISSASRMIPYFIDALRYQTGEGINNSPDSDRDNAAIAALVHLGVQSEAAALKALKDSDGLVRRRAVIVLSILRPSSRSRGKSLAFMLRDPDENVRIEAEKGLVNLGVENIEEVRKGLEWKEPESRLAASRVLAALGEKTPKVVSLLQESLNKASCDKKVLYVEPLTRIDAESKELLQPALADCLFQDSLSDAERSELLAALERFAPLLPNVASHLVEVLKSETSGQTRLEILSHAEALGLSVDSRTECLALLLRSSDNVIKDRAAALLLSVGKSATKAVPQLKKLAEDDDTDGALRNRAALVLAELQPDAFDWQAFFLKELESEHSQWAMSILSEMNPEMAIPFFETGLKKLSAEKRVLVVALIAEFGPKAISLKPNILQLLKGNDPLTRHKASLALLSMDPADPEALPALRRELAGKYADDLLTEKLPETAIPLLEQAAANPTSVVEEQTAKGLLLKLRARKVATKP